ncbi:hypothetical protein IFM89_008434 [Coptis chinensis]|uniref:Early flowering 3 n=1 Tax=Coptis chinensis TaxID=261450 RepID=A0A835IB31_9MAGN|nr:hypothetical protein IFM89_008434 [Coptis chinensis]
MEPMFPRIHIKDTEKGGPRPPPRNKMALFYEQLSVPSQRCGSKLPRSRTVAGRMVSSGSSSQGGRQEKTVFSPTSILPPVPVHSSAKEAYNRASNIVGNLLSSIECDSFLSNDISKSENLSLKKLGDVGEFGVPSLVQLESTPCSSKDQLGVGGEIPSLISLTHQSRATLKSTGANCDSISNHLKSTNMTCLTSRQHQGQHSGMVSKETSTSKGGAQEPASHPSFHEKTSEPLDHNYGSSNQKNQHNAVDDLGGVCDKDTLLHQDPKSCLKQNSSCCAGVMPESLKSVAKGNVSVGERDSCSKSSLDNGHRNPDGAQDSSEYFKGRAHVSQQTNGADRNDNISETSMMDSILDLGISPDDVVGVLGQKHFWKARSLIVNQQRLFSVQLFELHRLMEVQRFIAGSPHLLLEDNFNLCKASPAKKLPIDDGRISPPQAVKQKDEKLRSANATENVVGKPSTPDDFNEGIVTENPSYGACSRIRPPEPVYPSSEAISPWCFHPPSGNQWLLPIMSPTEGLVYKPYLAPTYGGYGPMMSLAPLAGGFLNPAYGAPSIHPHGMSLYPLTPRAPMYYQPTHFPHCIPIICPVIASSGFEEPLAGTQPHQQVTHLPMCDVNGIVQSQSPFKMLNQKSVAVSSCTRDDELELNEARRSPIGEGIDGGQASEGRDVLPPPLSPVIGNVVEPLQTQCRNQKTPVIKVVPHNPRSATESATRIFRFLQEERQQY